MQQPTSSDETGSIELWQTPEEMLQGFDVIRQLYPEFSLEDYRNHLASIQGMNYRQFAYFSEDRRCLGVVGLWLFPRLWCGLQADIDNFIVDKNARSLGIGRRLLNHCLAYATEREANVAVLDTFVANPDSHRFYFREGFNILGYHFVKSLKEGRSLWD